MKFMRINGLQVETGISVLAAIAGFSTWMNPPAIAQLAQNRPLTIFENVTLSPNFAPTTVRGISGGTALASEIAGRQDTATGPCVGFVDREPDHQMVLTEFFDYLSLRVQSTEDTTLVVRGPGGSWCNDDYDGFNPGIAGQWFSGTYEIWVGSYNSDGFYPYVIQIESAP